MKSKTCNKQLIIYELLNLAGNPFTAFFGIIFPLLMLIVITTGTITSDAPADMQGEINTSVFITISLIIPMAVVLLGHSANYSQELEKEIPVRMKLFGFSERSIMVAKAIAQIIVMTLGLVVYTIFSFLIVDLELPKASSAFCLIFCQYLLGALFFVLAHALANIFKKFGPTYAIAMTLYFGIMMVCGMMGIETAKLPEPMKYIAKMLPMSHIGSDFIDFWQGGSYNFGPLIQSFLFCGAICGILLLYANHKNRRVIK